MPQENQIHITPELYGDTLGVLRRTAKVIQGVGRNMPMTEFIELMKQGGYYAPSSTGALSDIENGKHVPGKRTEETESFITGSMEVLGIFGDNRRTYAQIATLSVIAFELGEDIANIVAQSPEFADLAERRGKMIARVE